LKSTGLSSQSESESKSDANAKDSNDDSLSTPNLWVPRANWEQEDEDFSPTSDVNANHSTARTTTNAAALPSNNTGTKKKSSVISKVPIILYDAMVEKLDGKSTIYSKTVIKNEIKSVQKHRNAIITASAKVKQQIPDLYCRAKNHKIFPANVGSKAKKIEFIKCCVLSFAVACLR
jgi:hypothetical protein